MKIPSRGFTFIEIIIYVAVLAVFSILVVDIILVLTESFGRFKTANRINSSAEVALERMVREIRLADDIDVSGSILNVSPGRLILKTIDPLTETTVQKEIFLDVGLVSVLLGLNLKDSMNINDLLNKFDDDFIDILNKVSARIPDNKRQGWRKRIQKSEAYFFDGYGGDRPDNTGEQYHA